MGCRNGLVAKIPIAATRRVYPSGGARFTKPAPMAPVAPGSYTSAAIILLSDGRRTTGVDTLEAAKLAKELEEGLFRKIPGHEVPYTASSEVKLRWKETKEEAKETKKILEST